MEDDKAIAIQNANGRLLAAAPEMLAAIKSAESILWMAREYGDLSAWTLSSTSTWPCRACQATGIVTIDDSMSWESAWNHPYKIVVLP